MNRRKEKGWPSAAFAKEAIRRRVSPATPEQLCLMVRRLFVLYGLKEFPIAAFEYTHKLVVGQHLTCSATEFVESLPAGWVTTNKHTSDYTSFTTDLVEMINSENESKVEFKKPQISEVLVKSVPDVRAAPPEMIDQKFKWCYQQLPDSINIGDSFNVYIPEVECPSCFYVQLRRHNRKLVTLMNKLDEFYEHHDEDCLTIDVIVGDMDGMLVAAYYCSDRPKERGWHRAIIISAVSPEKILLRFIDFGTQTSVNVTHIRWLHVKFGALPAQAIPAMLAGIHPVPGRIWSRAAVNSFRDVQQKREGCTFVAKLVALVKCVLPPRHLYEGHVKGLVLCLYDTDNKGKKNSTCFNERFVEWKLARTDECDINPQGLLPWQDPDDPSVSRIGVEEREREDLRASDAADTSNLSNFDYSNELNTGDNTQDYSIDDEEGDRSDAENSNEVALSRAFELVTEWMEDPKNEFEKK